MSNSLNIIIRIYGNHLHIRVRATSVLDIYQSALNDHIPDSSQFQLPIKCTVFYEADNQYCDI